MDCACAGSVMAGHDIVVRLPEFTMNRPLPRHAPGGAALLMVLLCLALVSLTLTSLSEQGRRDLARLSELQAQTQADFYAQGAEVIARRALTDAAVRQAGLWWQSLRGRSLSYPTDHGRIHLNVEDLRGCLNLNALAGTRRPGRAS
ncbi:general secretion pathway protein K [Halomonas elongata]|uniref:General secretion pathway protein K n=1 Tax=Halomonas elongata TaxID=2746 RepID=A0A1B8NV00_HALEL|nr:general secretion pathway protein K [Halomonas elongata]